MHQKLNLIESEHFLPNLQKEKKNAVSLDIFHNDKFTVVLLRIILVFHINRHLSVIKAELKTISI